MITATLIGGAAPQNVQIVVDVTPAGVPWTLTGEAGDHSWTVPGGEGVGDGQQLVLADNRTPGNVPIIYTFRAGAAAQTSAPIVVPIEGRDDLPGHLALQTLSGSRSLIVGLLKGSLETQMVSGQVRHRVAGRRRPVIRHDVTSDVEGTLVVLVETAQQREFDEMLAEGTPLLYRLGVEAMDLSPVGVFSYGDPTSVAYQARGLRAWSLPYALIDDPYLDVRLAGFSWDYFDDVWEGQTWNAFDAQMAGLTWDQFDMLDWSTL
ncbi:hypothetical protein [Microbacterium sp. NPDC089696]|uniref:hypothetical protein n=1 Tax=Microbacterium sp. NPDC089696 TaxID=3364199 RepID=UPI003817E44F